MLASESSLDLRPSPDDDTVKSAADPSRWLADTSGVEEIWVDWQLLPSARLGARRRPFDPAMTWPCVRGTSGPGGDPSRQD